MSAGQIHLLEDVLPPDLLQAVWQVCCAKHWYFGNFSVTSSEPGFWKMDLDGVHDIDRLWAHLKPRCEALAGHALQVVRQYANGHTYGLGGQIHTDDNRERFYTLLFYPMLRWDPAWGGETVFHRPNGEILAALLPRPNRAAFFDARIPHAGRAANRSYGGLRVTVAFKLGPPADSPAAAPSAASR